MDFNSMMFNNNYVNQAYYQQQQEQILRYQFAQDEEVRKAVHAIKDLCDAVKKMDDEHQRQAFWACLAAWQMNIDGRPAGKKPTDLMPNSGIFTAAS